ncbi:MAG: hypothetical protein Kow0088_13830 [Anaerolineales bacterium]
MSKRVFILCVGLFLLLPQRVVGQEASLTVVLADPSDAYYPLAQEIARAEHIPLFHRRTEALAAQPTYLLWVVSPSALSDAALIAMGQSLAKQPVALGILTASTIEQARSLWVRAKEVKGEIFVAANAANPAAHIAPQIMLWQRDQSQTYVLSKASLLHFLQEADYLTFTGHGGSRYWRLDAETRLTAADLGNLPPIVVQSGSCNTFRIWEKDSIALAFVDQGAAAYVGFAYSPNEGYLIGEFHGFPYRYSHPDFPIGFIVQLQNRGAIQGFAAFPYLFLLGDPRLSLQGTAPYTLFEDQREGMTRTLVYRDLPKGFVPIRVRGGAEYSFIDIAGIASASQSDPFYHNRVQMMDVGADKLILIESDGGELILRIDRQTPWHWQAFDLLTDALDFALVFLPQSGGDWASAIFAIFPLGWVLLQIRRKQWQKRIPVQAFVFGTMAGFLQVGYCGVRLNSITIISKAVKMSPLAWGIHWFLACSGAWMFFTSRAVWKKGFALSVILFPVWFPLLSVGLIVEGFNRLVAVPHLGVPLYNHHATQLLLIAGIFILSLSVLFLRTLRPRSRSID